MRHLPLGLLLLVAGCATLTVKEGKAPDGGSVYEAVCRGGGYSFADCMNLAYHTCGGPYEVLETEAQGTQTTVHLRWVTLAVSPDMKRKGMTFRCKDDSVSEDLGASP